jgi:hypothetical protein
MTSRAGWPGSGPSLSSMLLPTLCRATAIRPPAPWALCARRVRFASSAPPPTTLARLPASRRTLSSSRPFFDTNARVPPASAPPPGVAAAQTPSIAPVKRVLFARTRRVLRWGAYLTFSSVLGLSLVTGVIFLHDAFTYNSAHIDRVPVNPLALHPETGGPKKLPVVRAYLEDEEDKETRNLATKPKLVVVGSGWGVSCILGNTQILVDHAVQAVGVLQTLNPGDYHVTVVSPDTFTTFTPLLPCKGAAWPCLRLV